MTKLVAILGALLLVAGSAIAFDGIEPMRLGSKSDPEASLFTYDQKFSDTTTLKNYYLGMSAYKDFNGCDRLSSNIYLESNSNWTDIAILANFSSGTGRMGYLVLDEDTMDIRDVMVDASHEFIGNFTIDERILVVKNQMNESGFFGNL
ncbi:MAG: hypothetical protein WCY97_06470 [Methanothrix sp.]|jgi:hypothetical protein|uniref:Uncharacterized protein n=1 Tax=Methanothrix harundinacea TaxID=301375 RepID=A0A101FUC1_9EURY|nr:MAG: hypothetical protein APR56_07530 [Methanosaeta sp. SDB]KUK44469.1 MAG: Uncharacterized protein XD72_1136 [Methanothrix harundinacea]MDD2638705.1 hypothetical protein [Methanothrix sp.]MDI9400237.1 hypothetical protein [Euryarchaeota archaeon]KUK95766.1 MAG: Uncharacterized protein XE07_1616 [Methanothrix harundinacea]